MYRNECILVLFAFFGLVASNLIGSDVIDQNCVEETKITEQELSKNGNLTMGDEYDEKIACYNVCSELNKGTIEEDGTLKFATIKEKISLSHYQLFHRFWAQCKRFNTAGDPCRTLFDFGVCYLRMIRMYNPDLLWQIQ